MVIHLTAKHPTDNRHCVCVCVRACVCIYMHVWKCVFVCLTRQLKYWFLMQVSCGSSCLGICPVLLSSKQQPLYIQAPFICGSAILSALKVLSIHQRGEERTVQCVPGKDLWTRSRRFFTFIAFSHQWALKGQFSLWSSIKLINVNKGGQVLELRLLVYNISAPGSIKKLLTNSNPLVCIVDPPNGRQWKGEREAYDLTPQRTQFSWRNRTYKQITNINERTKNKSSEEGFIVERDYQGADFRGERE